MMVWLGVLVAVVALSVALVYIAGRIERRRFQKMREGVEQRPKLMR